MTNQNPWELYQARKGWRAASGEISRAVRHAGGLIRADKKAGATEAKAFETGWAYMDSVLMKYADFGAMDSEPLHHIGRRFWGAYHNKVNHYWLASSVDFTSGCAKCGRDLFEHI